jgi:hypothetical protein
VVYNGVCGLKAAAETMLGHKEKSVRLATLLVMAVSLVVSAGRVVHAHVDGDHVHPLRTAGDHDHCHVEPVVWHAHIWLLGWEVHVPVAGHDDQDSDHPPVDLSPSWSDLPTIVDAAPLAVPAAEVSLDCVAELLVPTPLPLDIADDCPPHSGLSPGYATRILMASLTL